MVVNFDLVGHWPMVGGRSRADVPKQGWSDVGTHTVAQEQRPFDPGPRHGTAQLHVLQQALMYGSHDDTSWVAGTTTTRKIVT